MATRGYHFENLFLASLEPMMGLTENFLGSTGLTNRFQFAFVSGKRSGRMGLNCADLISKMASRASVLIICF